MTIAEPERTPLNLEGLVSTDTTLTRRFTFEPPGAWEHVSCSGVGFAPSLVSLWLVMLGDRGLLICNHKTNKIDKLFIASPNFALIYKEFGSLKKHLEDEGVEVTEPVLCWLRGLIHAFMAENPNPVNCSVVMTGTSCTAR